MHTINMSCFTMGSLTMHCQVISFVVQQRMSIDIARVIVVGPFLTYDLQFLKSDFVPYLIFDISGVDNALVRLFCS